MKKRYLTDFLAAVSISNLLFVFGRGSTGTISGTVYHYFGSYASVRISVSFIVAVLLLAILLFSIVRIDRYFNQGYISIVSKTGFLIGFLIFLHELRVYLLTIPFLLDLQNKVEAIAPRIVYLLIVGLVAALLVFLALKWKLRLFEITKHVILVLSPFFAFNLYNHLSDIYNVRQAIKLDDAVAIMGRSPAPSQRISANRVVWIVFDELDYHLISGGKPDSVELPEITRFRESAINFTNAASPAHDTLEAIPSLLIGKEVQKAQYLGVDNLGLNFSDGTYSELRSSQTVVSLIKNSQRRSAVIGWYHPYCRILQDADFCYWADLGLLTGPLAKKSERSFPSLVKDQFESSLVYFPFWFRVFGEVKNEQQNSIDIAPTHYQKVLESLISKSKTVSADPAYDLVFLHLPIPHLPYLYDRKTRSFNGKGNYLSNLELADNTLKELRVAMESKGLWNDSTIIISSDHPWRLDKFKIDASDEAFEATNGGKKDPRIPFMIKLRGQSSSVNFEKPVNSVVTKEIVIEILEEKIKSPKDLTDFMEGKVSDSLRP